MKDGQGAWFGGARVGGDVSNFRHSDMILEPGRSSDLRPCSPSSSINFSYPRSMSDAGLGGSEGDQTLIYDANSRRMVPRSELLMREQSIRIASGKPVKKKKQSVSRGGSHLSKGNVSRIQGTAVQAQPSSSAQSKAEEEPEAPATVVKKACEEVPPITEKEPVDDGSGAISKKEPQQDVPSESESGLESDSDVEPPDVVEQRRREVMAPTLETARPTPPLQRPAVIEEDAEPEEETAQEKETLPQARVVPISEEALTQPSPPISTPPEDRPVEPQLPPQALIDKPIASVQRTRMHSESPTRTPHFGTATDKLTVIHEPPPRSLSPRKSALKHRSPTRNASPSEDGSEASSALVGSLTGDDTAARRRSVRVSFDDQRTVVVGDAAGSSDADGNQLPSPQNKKTWQNLTNRNKRDSVTLDDNEKMAPRPALPFFGSIREKKTRDLEERPLVRPSERGWSSPLNSPASPQSADGPSTDMAIGAILAQDQSSRNAANISRYREPLPPVVTSVDSSGHISNTESDSEPEQHVPEIQSLAKAEAGSDESIPMISISQPSPRASDETQPDSPDTFFDVPGGFPDEDSASKSDESRTPTLDDAETSLLGAGRNARARSSISQLPPQLPPITTQRLESIAASPPSPLIHDIQEEDEEASEGDSIYSDAYEDLSDIEGDGFMSLAAIVDSPVSKVSQKPPAKTDTKLNEKEAPKGVSTTDPQNAPGDWENAKAYWKSLSLEKRRQLEHEAMEEAGEEGDYEEATPPKKTKKRKPLDKAQEEPQQKVPTERHREAERVYQIRPGTSWPVPASEASSTAAEKETSLGGKKAKKSPKGEQATVTRSGQTSTMRESMRSSGGAHPTGIENGRLRKSLRSEPEGLNGSAVDKARTQRPVSYQAPPAGTAVTRNARRTLSADGVGSPLATASTGKPSLRRRGSDSSESSFRRARVGGGGGEGFGFKKTMRGSVRDSGTFSGGGRGSSRFSLRSLSPTGSRAMSPTTVAGGRMRQSLRSNSTDNRRLSGFSRSTGKKGKKGPGGSRFADSSDEEDDGGRPAFHSRFVDSSDDDDETSWPAPRHPRNKTSSSAAAAAMGVPQPPSSQRLQGAREEDEDEDESPDLSDSDDEVQQQQQQPIATDAPRPARRRRGSFMSILRRRKDGEGGKISRRPLGDSGARRDTKLERSREQLASMRSTSARLHRRGQEEWPLGNEEQQQQQDDHDTFDGDSNTNTYVNDEKRPSTASGASPSSSLPLSPVKHGFLKRRSTSQGALGGLGSPGRGGGGGGGRPVQGGAGAGSLPVAPLMTASVASASVMAAPDGQNAVVAEADSIPDMQRKKKFGTLRKMFGLHD